MNYNIHTKTKTKINKYEQILLNFFFYYYYLLRQSQIIKNKNISIKTD